MKSIQWLVKYDLIQDEIELIEWDIRKTKIELKRWERNGDLFNKNRLETAVSQQQRLGQALINLENVLNEKHQLKNDLLELINSFRGLDNQILKMKYIDGLTLEVIAYKLQYSPQYIYNRHAEIKRSLKLLENLSGGG
ncbi:hypothetical protein [Amphibacillus marinus]|nr:hypothetical protein [Amphibacillus marinus]